DVLFAGRAGLASRVMRAEPGGQPQRFFRGAEVLVVPACAAWRRRDEANRLVVDALDLVLMSVRPRIDAAPLRPGVGVALALDADQHRRAGVCVRLGVAA